MVASALLILLGATGLVGRIAKCVGPITICPVTMLLALGTVPTIEQKLNLHWISVLLVGPETSGLREIAIGVLFITVLEKVRVPLPFYSVTERRLCTVGVRIFSQFPVCFSF